MGEHRWDSVHAQVNSCALTGAAAFFAGIPGAVIVMNGPLWCYYYALRYLEKPCPAIGTRFFCSQVDNHTVVYGTEEYLLDVLQDIRQNLQPSVILIENSCSVTLIGDDIAGIAGQAGMSCPVVCIDSGGLHGGFWEGYRAAGQAYFSMMPLQKRGMVQPHSVNLLGCTVGYYNAASDVRELKRMLELAGYQVVACPGAGSSREELEAMSRAELNLVIHEELGGELARYLQQEYGIPYLSLLPPYGAAGSWDWLKTLGETMWMGEQSLKAVQQEADHLKRHIRTAILELERLWGNMSFKRALVAAPSSVALGMAQAVRTEWADCDIMTAAVYDDKWSYSVPSAIDIIVDGYNDSQALETQLAQLSGGLLLGTSNEKSILQQQAVTDVVSQNIALPVYDEVLFGDRPFMGFRGTSHMVERLWNQYISFCQRGW